MVCKIQAVTDNKFLCELKNSMEFGNTCYQPKQSSLFRSIFWSFTSLWVKIGYRNKSSCFGLNSVQTLQSIESSRSFQGKGCLLRFQSNRTATSDGSVKKLKKDIWHHSELIATKVWKNSLWPNQPKMKYDFWKPCRDFHWQDKLQLKMFWAICLWK